KDPVAAPASWRGLAVCGRGPRPQFPRYRSRQGGASPLEEGGPYRRRSFPLASALQRRSGQSVPAGARAYVRLGTRNHARVDGPDGSVRGGRGHAGQHGRTVEDTVARVQASGVNVDRRIDGSTRARVSSILVPRVAGSAMSSHYAKLMSRDISHPLPDTGGLELSKAVLPPGVLSLHVLPADHHDRDWDNIVV